MRTTYRVATESVARRICHLLKNAEMGASYTATARVYVTAEHHAGQIEELERIVRSVDPHARPQA